MWFNIYTDTLNLRYKEWQITNEFYHILSHLSRENVMYIALKNANIIHFNAYKDMNRFVIKVICEFLVRSYFVKINNFLILWQNISMFFQLLFTFELSFLGIISHGLKWASPIYTIHVDTNTKNNLLGCLIQCTPMVHQSAIDFYPIQISSTT